MLGYTNDLQKQFSKVNYWFDKQADKYHYQVHKMINYCTSVL